MLQLGDCCSWWMERLHTALLSHGHWSGDDDVQVIVHWTAHASTMSLQRHLHNLQMNDLEASFCAACPMLAVQSWTFGPGTAGSLKEFQQAAGLSATGVFDSGTWLALLSQLPDLAAEIVSAVESGVAPSVAERAEGGGTAPASSAKRAIQAEDSNDSFNPSFMEFPVTSQSVSARISFSLF